MLAFHYSVCAVRLRFVFFLTVFLIFRQLLTIMDPVPAPDNDLDFTLDSVPASHDNTVLPLDTVPVSHEGPGTNMEQFVIFHQGLGKKLQLFLYLRCQP